MDDRTPVLDVHRYSDFRPLRTIWVVSSLIIVLLMIECITLAYVFVLQDRFMLCELYYLIMYAEAFIWFTFAIIRLYINWQHKMYLLARGYFESYEHLSKFIEWSFFICSSWLGIMLVITCLYVQYAPQGGYFCQTEYIYSPIVVVTILLTLQNLLLTPLFAVYIIVVDKFNKRQVQPDSENGNQYMPSVLRDNMFSEETGYREREEMVDKLVEKQADLIRYYKEANEMLNKKLFDLTSQGHGLIDPVV